MDYNRRFDQIESILTDVLKVQDRLAAGQEQLVRGQQQLVIGQQQLVIGQEQLVTGQEQLIGTVDRMGLVMDKMLDVLIETKDEIKGLRADNERWEQHERRIKRIEQTLSIKGE